MLRIAVPNKGMLSEPAWNILSEAGYRLRSNPRQLVVEDPDNEIELFYLRPLDIAVYVGRGTIDVGITGRDLLLNSGTEAIEHMQLGFGASTFRFAAPNDAPIHELADIDGKRVASSYDKLVSDYLTGRGIHADIIHLDGAVESSVQLGVADLIADVVSTGTTLRNAGLRVFGDPILHSEAILIRSPAPGRRGRASDRAGSPSAGCAHRAAVRADGFRHPRGEGLGRRRHHAWFRKPHGLPVAR